MDDLAALDAASKEFGQRLATLEPGTWDTATACGDWDVTALVRHINVGNKMSELLLAGADAKTSIGPDAQPADDADPIAVYAATSAAQLAAFHRDGALTMTVAHPAMAMPGDLLLMFRSLDLALHAWDLAIGVGGDTTLNEEMCQAIWAKLEPIAPLLAGSGMFGEPQRELGESPTAYDRLLHATGR